MDRKPAPPSIPPRSWFSAIRDDKPTTGPTEEAPPGCNADSLAASSGCNADSFAASPKGLPSMPIGMRLTFYRETWCARVAEPAPHGAAAMRIRLQPKRICLEARPKRRLRPRPPPRPPPGWRPVAEDMAEDREEAAVDEEAPQGSNADLLAALQRQAECVAGNGGAEDGVAEAVIEAWVQPTEQAPMSSMGV